LIRMIASQGGRYDSRIAIIRVRRDKSRLYGLS
jgi:hypothetical protein